MGSRIRRSLGTVRGRSTAVAVATVLLALILGAAALLIAFGSTLVGNLDSSLLTQAQDRAQLLDNGSDPDLLTNLQRSESFVWIGSPDGTAIAVAGNYIPTQSPIPERFDTALAMTLQVEEQTSTGVEIEESGFRVASATSADGDLIVVTGAEVEVVGQNVSELALLFAIAIPFVTALVGLLTWRTVGSALGPVDDIRQQAETITGSSMSDRVPVPEAQDEIADLASTMNQMLDRLETHRDSLRQFTSDASHELKSPVANMRALVETTTLDDPQWANVQNRLVSEGHRLQSLVENLLFLASHSETSGTTERSPVHLDDILFDEAATLSASTGVSVNIDAVEPVTVSGVEADLKRLVRNLFDNAAQHATKSVKVSLSELSDRAILTVADDGPGIPAGDREKVFDRFTRLDYARDRNSGGTGLGLSIVEQIADSHYADVRIEDVEPTGAAFIVTFYRHGV